MDAVATFLTEFAVWLLGSSLQGSVVIVLVLLVQWRRAPSAVEGQRPSRR